MGKVLSSFSKGDTGSFESLLTAGTSMNEAAPAEQLQTADETSRTSKPKVQEDLRKSHAAGWYDPQGRRADRQ